MNTRLHSVRIAAAVACMLAGARIAAAGPILYTFGADGSSIPASLSSMDPTSPASVANLVASLGADNIGFNGGVVYTGGLLYAVGNDSGGNATIYSFNTLGQNLTATSSDFNTTGDASGYVFQNGLAAIGSSLYAIGAGPSDEDLFEIGNGSATLISALNTYNGTYAGLAYDQSTGEFYGVIANAASGSNTGDLLVEFGLSGNVSVVANLTSLDGADPNTHLGGLADAGGGILYAIYTNTGDGNGELEQILLNGSPQTTALYDTNIPLAQNAGVAITPASTSSVPEPTLGAAVLLACGFMFRMSRRRSARSRG